MSKVPPSSHALTSETLQLASYAEATAASIPSQGLKQVVHLNLLPIQVQHNLLSIIHGCLLFRTTVSFVLLSKIQRKAQMSLSGVSILKLIFNLYFPPSPPC